MDTDKYLQVNLDMNRKISFLAEVLFNNALFN